MPKRGNAVSLIDRYDLKDLEPDVDPEKAAAFLAGVDEEPRPAPTKTETRAEHKPSVRNKQPSAEPANPVGQTGDVPLRERHVARPDVWTSRTIRLRQSTANALTKAACGQKTKQVEGKLKLGEAVTVQEIAEQGIRLALVELGYLKK